MSEIKRCPCGQVPTMLSIAYTDGYKYAKVAGNCCSEWGIEFRIQYYALDSDEARTLALQAWNEAPRGLIETIRTAAADYIRTEGCGCCSNVERHKEHAARLAELLDVPMYSDESGYAFHRFISGKPAPE